MKQTYTDFRTCLETIRAHMATDGYGSQSHTTDFGGALTMGASNPSPRQGGGWFGWVRMLLWPHALRLNTLIGLGPVSGLISV